MATNKTKEIIKEIKIQPINLEIIKLKIIGKTPLLMDKMPDSAKEAILAKQTGVSKSNKKMVRDIEKEQEDAIHYYDKKKGIVGFPAEGFKRGMMECTSFVGDKMFSKKLVSGAINIVNSNDKDLIPIYYKKQTILEHNIEHNIKFTPMFIDWSTELEIEFDANTITPDDIVKLLNYAGFYNGVGAWRKKCRDGGSGKYGAYEVEMK